LKTGQLVGDEIAILVAQHTRRGRPHAARLREYREWQITAARKRKLQDVAELLWS
jgi:hypothetical protein